MAGATGEGKEVTQKEIVKECYCINNFEKDVQ